MSRFYNITAIIAISWSLFELYTVFYGAFPALIQRTLHVVFALSLVFSMKRLHQDKPSSFLAGMDYLTIFLPLFIGGYVIFQGERLTSRIYFVDQVVGLDLWLGILFVLLVLEASRRIIGNAITILAILFIVYGFLGSYFSGLLSHRGLNLNKMIDLMFLSTQGILGIPVAVAMDYVFYFILFGAFLSVSGGGQLFIDIAFKLTKGSKGGPAKAAIVSSGLMGSISGSAVANVVSTGIFTIPLMKKAGYSSKDAAAVESIASTGGQIMPPILGAAAFIMAEMIGVPYTEIILTALIPALLYYFSIMIIVHLKAVKENIGQTSEDVLEKREKIMSRIHLLLPLVVLLTMIFYGYSLSMAACWSILSIIVVSFFRKNTSLNFISVVSALEDGAKQAVQVTIPCAAAGIIVGVIGFSGLGLRFTSIIIDWSLGNFILALILVALGCIVLGMGMPTTSAYILAAILLAPSLQEFSVIPLAAHMFVFYFACLSMITPPVALAAFAAAGISGSNMGETGVRAFLLSLSAFLIPFAFVVNPSLLLIGEIKDIIWMTCFTTFGIVGLSVAIVGHLFTKVSGWLRVVFFISALMMIAPNFLTDILGIVLFGTLVITQRIKSNSMLRSDIPI